MSRARFSLLALTVFLIMNTVAATSAHASEGPFYTIAEGRLLIGETQEAESSSTKAYELAWGSVKIKCEKEKGEKVVLSGSIATTGSSGEQTMILEGCTVSGNGTGCELEGKKFKTEKLLTKLEFSNEKGKAGEHVLVALTPASGGIFAKLKFVVSEASKCSSSETVVEGSTGGEELEGKQAVVKAGENEAESETDYIDLPAVPLKTEWFEEESVRKEAKMGLKAGKVEAVLTGRASLKLPLGKKIGVFTAQPGSLRFTEPAHLFAAVNDVTTVTLENASPTINYKVTNIGFLTIIAGGPYYELLGSGLCEKEILAETSCSFMVKYIKKSLTPLTPEGVIVKIQGTGWRPAFLLQGL